MKSRAVVLLSSCALLVAAGVGPAMAAAPTAAPAGQLAGLDMETVTIPQLEAAMDAGRLSAVQLTRFYLDRITAIEPLVNAVIDVNEDALAAAAASDRRRQGDGPVGVMEGIPVLVKDNVDTVGLTSTAGSYALAGSRPAQDADLVQRLYSAGAIVLAKTNLSEWANFRSTNSTSGWSAVGGQTNNPYVLDRNPCGSSSGSAAGVAASLAVVAIGTETDGSIVCPAGQNGVVGLKPTLGAVSGAGIVPISAEQDVAGPIARNVTDAAIVFSVISQTTAAGDVTAAVAPAATSLAGTRIGVWSSVTGDTSPGVDALLDQTVARLQALGVTTVEVTPPYQDQININEFPALLYEFAHDVNAYLAATPGAHPADLAGLIAFNNATAPVELRYFDQDIFQAAQTTGGDLTDPRYIKNRTVATSAAQRSIDETLATYDLDAIVAPTNSPAWLSTLGEGDNFRFGSSGPAAVAGYPDLTVPMGYVGPLPIGLSMFASANSEATLLGLGSAFERAFPVRHAPTYLPTLPS